jgi:acyl carrier protein
MTDDEVLALVATALREAAPNRDFGTLTLETHVRDLRLDSIEFIQMMCAVEEAIGHELPRQVMMRVRTLADIAPLLQSAVLTGRTDSSTP